MRESSRGWFGLVVLVGMLPAGGGTAAAVEETDTVAEFQGKKLTHEETLAWVTEHRAWRLARKTRPIWARAVRPDEVGKLFQTVDGVAEEAKLGAWLCVGIAGEPWFQARAKIAGKYAAAGEVRRRFAFDDQPRDYTLFKPQETARNWVAQVQGDGIAGFSVRPSYDPTRPLSSPAGGWVVRDDVPDPYAAPPKDVWLVQEALFRSTYELIP